MRDAPEFATFWRGPLHPLAYSCIASFPRIGARLRVYSYEDDLDLPPDLEPADARDICPDVSLLDRYIAAGRPSLAMFADMFRYKLIEKTGCCWVDADLVCLRQPDFWGDPIVFGRQAEARGKALINNAALKLPPGHPLLVDLVHRAEAVVDSDQTWGAIGPFLLTDLAEKHCVDKFARDVFEFYPIDADHFWQPLLPAYRDVVDDASKRSTFLHLWSAMFARSSYDPWICPPPDSFLHGVFAELGTLERFQRVYDAGALSHALADWTARDEPLATRL